jgi:hypothetical protein
MTENPFDSLETTIATHSRDWSSGEKDAWVYGIVCGWGNAISDVQEMHGWSDETVARLKRLRAEFERMAELLERGEK